MTLTVAAIQVCPRNGTLQRSPGLHSAVSLHCHSSRSKETLKFVPHLARQLPVLAKCFDRSMGVYERHHGEPLDFGRWYWRPPLDPAAVFASEYEHLSRRLDCRALVSLTDHDNMEGPKALRAAGRADVPLSVEWSVPFDATVFHLGVHAVAPARVEEVERVLGAYTETGEGDLGEIFDWLVESPETFIVLNHPYWDMSRLGAMRHESVLLQFVRAHRDRIHALELNGYRMWGENRRVLPLAEGFGLPIVGGGDRHGRTPNAIVNLTRATCLAEFAHDLRAGRPTHTVMFEEYTDPFSSRLLQGARDCLTRDQEQEGRTWAQRVFYSPDRGVTETPLSEIWNGAPHWLNAAVGVTDMLGSAAARYAFRMATPGRNRELKADIWHDEMLPTMPQLETPPGSAAGV